MLTQYWQRWVKRIGNARARFDAIDREDKNLMRVHNLHCLFKAMQCYRENEDTEAMRWILRCWVE
jgi:hypothetical protein